MYPLLISCSIQVPLHLLAALAAHLIPPFPHNLRNLPEHVYRLLTRFLVYSPLHLIIRLSTSLSQIQRLSASSCTISTLAQLLSSKMLWTVESSVGKALLGTSNTWDLTLRSRYSWADGTDVGREVAEALSTTTRTMRTRCRIATKAMTGVMTNSNSPRPNLGERASRWSEMNRWISPKISKMLSWLVLEEETGIFDVLDTLAPYLRCRTLTFAHKPLEDEASRRQ